MPPGCCCQATVPATQGSWALGPGPPGWGRGSSAPHAGPGSITLLQGLAWACCSGWASAALGTSPLPTGASSRRSSSCPHPEGQRWAGDELPSPGEQGKVDVAGERHVDCNLSAGRTFLSEGPRASAVRGRGALQIFIANALKGVIAMEVVSAHIVSRAGVADPSQADRGELALWREETLGRTPTSPCLVRG